MASAPRSCGNAACGAALGEWRKGWPLRSGGYANLCVNCGMLYDQLIFCDMFHGRESGWRECSACSKRLHCGCVASLSFIVLLDNGGVQCINCAKNSDMSTNNKAHELEIMSCPRCSYTAKCKLCMAKFSSDRSVQGEVFQDSFLQLANRGFTSSARSSRDEKGNDFGTSSGRSIECKGQSSAFLVHRDNIHGSFKHIKQEEAILSVGDLGITNFPDVSETVISSQCLKRDDSKYLISEKGSFDQSNQGCLSISLGTPNSGHIAEAFINSGNSQFFLPSASLAAEGREQTSSQSAFQQVQRSRHFFPKSLKSSLPPGSESSKEVFSQMRVARPPGEGRGRNQLLPRYWPRITDQELQQISGDSNSTIVPLFEKVLSASDAGRIGRLVLPKACAEAYFPPISQPEGLPLKIQDAKGKDWVFQFRFWPNNNSRMYVLEGVTPCIQSMQLQAGDTVTFSRIDPEGKLVMGFRKATNSVPLQDSQISAIANGNESFLSGVIENLPIVSGYPGLLQSLKGTAGPHPSVSSEHPIPTDGISSCIKSDKLASRLIEGLPLQPLLVPERKRSRNISSKSKRLHIDDEDALELKLTWEEAQDLLRAPPHATPSVVMVEDHEFEEYEEPPILGKRTVFTVRTSGDTDQWAQCDDCRKWRRLPVDVLLLSKWTCADNKWDARRSFCAAPDEIGQKELQNLLRLSADLRKRKLSSTLYRPTEREECGLEALATAAGLGEADGAAAPSIAPPTTKHPRHRPGCTCIVCIQPPSGKGPKHKPTCTCNVCMTVKRRFKTLMMRKKKRQSEQEEAAETQKKLAWTNKDETEADSGPPPPPPETTPRNESEPGHDRIGCGAEADRRPIDLNYCQPERGAGDPQAAAAAAAAAAARVSMMSLLQVANLPLETYLKQNGLTSLACEQQASSGSHAPPQVPAEESIVVDEGCSEPDGQARDDPAA